MKGVSRMPGSSNIVRHEGEAQVCCLSLAHAPCCLVDRSLLEIQLKHLVKGLLSSSDRHGLYRYITSIMTFPLIHSGITPLSAPTFDSHIVLPVLSARLQCPEHQGAASPRLYLPPRFSKVLHVLLYSRAFVVAQWPFFVLRAEFRELEVQVPLERRRR